MRKVFAALLLACFGILLPTAAAPVRLCLLQERLLITEVSADDNCCSGCDRETNDRNPCCLDLEALPDASVPQPLIELPPVIVTALPGGALPAPLMAEFGPMRNSESTLIRGLIKPAAYRAVLGIWRL